MGYKLKLQDITFLHLIGKEEAKEKYKELYEKFKKQLANKTFSTKEELEKELSKFLNDCLKIEESCYKSAFDFIRDLTKKDFSTVYKIEGANSSVLADIRYIPS